MKRFVFYIVRKLSSNRLKLRNMARIGTVALILFFCWQPQVFATISVDVNPKKVRLGETFQLILSMDNLQENSSPDLRPLEKDFTILGTQRSMTYNVINGQSQSLHRWIVLLNPKNTGVLTIPAIQLGHQESMPSSVKVVGTATNASDNDVDPDMQDNIMLKTEINQPNPYIGQQVIYKVRLYTNTRLLNAQYIPPKVENALLIPLGDAHRYETTINDQLYGVEEQTYAVFAQKSGDFKILSPSFEALLFDSVPRQIRVHAKATTLHVKPIPKSNTLKHWLPANQVSLTETYDNSSNKLKQGDTLSRTITLQAFGVPAQLLPTIEIQSGSDFNAYSEKPDLNNTAQEDALVGRSEQKITYLLNKSGQITIPAIELHWFNVETGKEAITSLPAHTLSISMNKTKTSQRAAKVTPSKPSTKPTAHTPEVHENKLGIWLAASMAALWIVTLAVWWFYRRKGNPKKAALNELKKACSSNNPTKAQTALLNWAKSQWPESEFLNLNQLDSWLCDPDLKQNIAYLSQALYGQNKPKTWVGEDLWLCVKTFKTKKTKKTHSDYKLPGINPDI